MTAENTARTWCSGDLMSPSVGIIQPVDCIYIFMIAELCDNLQQSLNYAKFSRKKEKQESATAMESRKLMNENPSRRYLKKRFQRSFADIFIRFQEGSHCWKVILSTILPSYLRLCKVTRYHKWWVHLKLGCKINIDLCRALRILDNRIAFQWKFLFREILF